MSSQTVCEELKVKGSDI